MWIPRDTTEIEDAAKRGDLEETASFDAKADLPQTAKKNVTLAVDVAAMSAKRLVVSDAGASVGPPGPQTFPPIAMTSPPS
jgi:hypothetical protein